MEEGEFWAGQRKPEFTFLTLHALEPFHAVLMHYQHGLGDLFKPQAGKKTVKYPVREIEIEMLYGTSKYPSFESGTQ